MSQLRTLLLVVCIGMLNACAVGTSINYHDGQIELKPVPFNFKGGCSITVIDERPYVLSGKKAANFVGIRRGGYGNPFNVVTKSGRPLAEDLTIILTKGINATYGSDCNSSTTSPRKRITYTLKEWKTDVMIRGWFHYDVVTSISSDTALISSGRESGKIEINKGYQLNQAIIEAMNEIHRNPITSEGLAEFVGHVEEAIPQTSKEGSFDQPKSICTDEQIKVMKKNGFTIDQIISACKS